MKGALIFTPLYRVKDIWRNPPITSLSTGLWVGGLKSQTKKMEITKEKVREIAIRAFKLGQEKNECEDYPIRLWVEGELENA